MRIVLISDTHGKHGEVVLPEGDLVIHAGNVSSSGDLLKVKDFLDWFGSQPHKHKVFIAGNHDFYFESVNAEELEWLIPDSVVYLNDSGVEIEGVRIWGSPVQPRFFDWAFNRDRGEDLQKHWDLIPLDTDILVTHGPPFGIMDRTTSGLNVGCDDLLLTLQKLRLKLHVFGHIHEAYGLSEKDSTTYVNASTLDERYRAVNLPVVLDF